MTNRIIAFALALGFAVPAAADDRLVRFDGGIGVIPTGSANTTIRGVPAAGQIWVISRLSADVRTDGRISVDGRGLLLGAGNNIGTNGNQSVRRASSAARPLTATRSTRPGAARARRRFPHRRRGRKPGRRLPNVCERPVLLILNGAGTAWFAAGIPKL